jgi:hypothetical protein
VFDGFTVEAKVSVVVEVLPCNTLTDAPLLFAARISVRPSAFKSAAANPAGFEPTENAATARKVPST